MPAIPLPHSSNFREIFAHPTDPIEFGPPLKNTFAKVHGLGRIVYQSYPLLEKQGANLIVECILRSIVTDMEEKEMKSLRNVNVFLDNTSVNKCHTILAAMSCLVLLGMMLNVKLLINVALTIFSLSCVTTSFVYEYVVKLN